MSRTVRAGNRRMRDRLLATGSAVPTACRWAAVGIAAYLATVSGVAAAETADRGLCVAFVVSAGALLLSGMSLATGRQAALGVRLIEVLAGAAFALAIADLAMTTAFDENRYHALWIPSVLGLLAVLGRLGVARRVPVSASERGL